MKKTLRGIKHQIKKISTDEWLNEYAVMAYRSDETLITAGNYVTVYVYHDQEPVIEIIHNNVLLCFAFGSESIEMSFSTQFDGDSADFDEDIEVSRRMKEEQLFQLSLVHDLHWMDFDLFTLLVEFERKYYTKFQRPLDEDEYSNY